MARERIAYFSMEIAIRPEMHTYSGGLGVLAGDTVRACADLDLPMVFVTLASRQGYLRQEIRGGEQVGLPDPWRLEDWAEPLPAIIGVELEGRVVWVRPWLHVLQCPLGSEAPVIFLDTSVPQNEPQDQTITDRLYGGGPRDRLKQELVLGVGGLRALEALGFAIFKYHLNEGHAAFLPLALLRKRGGGLDRNGKPMPRAAAVERVRSACVFTTHTPVEAGHDRFPYQLVHEVAGDFARKEDVAEFAGLDNLNMTRLALQLSGYVNGVARRHVETSQRMFPDAQIRAITNGVHPGYWTNEPMARLFDVHAPAWRHEPELLARMDQVPDQDIWRAHEAGKHTLLRVVRERTGVSFNPAQPVLGFARRMTAYKRPDLLFHDVKRLRAIARSSGFSIVLAGKAHPQDEGGKTLIADLHAKIDDLKGDLPIAFLPDYDLSLAKLMVAGCDVWVNTPLPPLEASGTSGMKAALNGGLNLSVLDGWWLEAWIEGVTGWAIGQDHDGPEKHAEELYRKLAEVVLPLYGADRSRWIWMMKQSISKIGAYFNSQRMMRRYASEAYLGSANGA